MNTHLLNTLRNLLWSPLTFAALLSLATALLGMALAPSRPKGAMKGRLGGYLASEQRLETVGEARKPFSARVLLPLLRRTLRTLGKVGLGKGGVAGTTRLLMQAGSPWGMTAIDFMGLRLLAALVIGCGLILGLSMVASLSAPMVLIAVAAGGVGAILPMFWLNGRARRRKKLVLKALPDALDMLTIGVEAGLAFESSLLRVGERWDNPLTYEFRQALTEMRLGTPRDAALMRIVERTDVQELRTFVAILVQAHQLGLSIANVLHVQAEQMRAR
ncbi:MAG: type II secretion system F family protein, partial [Chloroflexota bacterium]